MKLSRTVDHALALACILAVPAFADGNNGHAPEPTGNVYHAGDAIELNVIGYEEDLNGIYEISTSGDMRIPYIGVVRAAGVGEAEFDQMLTAKIHSYYTARPEVLITPLYSITVLGSVYRPGPYQIQGGEPASRLIGLAGGARDNASIGSVRVTRAGESRKVDLKRALEKGDTLQDIGIRSGDVIFVPTRPWYKDWRAWAAVIGSISLAVAIYDRVTQ